MAGSAWAQFTWVGPGDPGATNNWDNANNWEYEGYTGVIVPGQDVVPGGAQAIINDGGYALIDAPLSQPDINELDIAAVGGGGIVAATPAFSDGFETYTDGVYTTSFGSWTVSSNQVIITNSPVAYDGTNLVDLTNGVISIVLPTQVGYNYLLQYACQGTGVSISGDVKDTFNTTNSNDWEVHTVRFLASDARGTAIQLQGVTNTLYNTVLDGVSLFSVQYNGTVLQTAGALIGHSWFNLGANGAGNANGTYNISGGSFDHLTGGNFDIGAGGVGVNAILIHGTGTVTNNSGPVLLGEAGNAGTNILSVTDNGSFVHLSTSDFNVGDGSAGCVSTLTISNSAALYSSANFFGIGHSGGNQGTVNLDGGTMTHAGHSQLSLGQGSPNALGTLNVNGGDLEMVGGASILVGDGVNSTGVVNIASGVIDHSAGGGTLNVGSTWFGTINQTGGFITNTTGDTYISSGSRANGTWNISGGVAQVNFIHIGNGSSSNATLNVSGTGLFISQQIIEMGASGNGINAINLNGGTLMANGIKSDGSGITNIINFNGGVLQAGANSGNFLNGLAGKGLALNLLAGGAVLNANGFAITMTNNLAGVGGLTNIGTSGTVTLSGNNTYTGNTVILGGELISATPASSLSAFQISSGATNGVVLNAANGQTTDGGLIYGFGTTYADFNFGGIAPSTTTAPILVNGNLAFNGTLDVIIRGTSITNTGTYPLIKYTGTLSGTPPAVAFSLPSSVLNATLVNDTANQSIDLNVSEVTFGPATFVPSPTGATVGSNAVCTMMVPSGATASGPCTVTLSSGNTVVTASQTVTLPQGVTSTNVDFPILAAGVATITATSPQLTPSTLQVLGAIPTISLPAATGAIVGSNAVVMMTITNQFPFSGSYTVTLTSGNTGVTASQTVILPQGVTSTNVSFPILGVGVANVTASGTGLNPATIQVTGAIPSIVLPVSATGNVGSNVTATMMITCPFPFSGPYTVTLTSGNTSVTPSQIVTLPAGVTSTNLSFPLLAAGLSTVTASGTGLNSASMTVGDTASVFAVGLASQWVGDDYAANLGNGWVDRVGGVIAALDGAGTAPLAVAGGFGPHSGVEVNPSGGSGFSIPGNNPPTGYTNYTVSVVLYSKTPGGGSGNYWSDQLIIGYDIGGGGQTDWGMSWGSSANGGQGVSVGIGQNNGDTTLHSTNALTGSASHAIAMQTSANNTFSLYVDGVLEGQATGLSLHAPTNSNGPYIPLLSDVDANNEFIGHIFTNMIAEVRIYTNTVNAAALTAYLQNLYMALPISLPASTSATVGTNAAATMTVPPAATSSGPVTVTLTSDNPGVTASQTVTLPQGVTSTNLSFPILGVGVANVTASATGLIPATVQITGLGLGQAIWTGSASDVWDINATANWLVNGSPSTYLDGSPVMFNDTGANPNVSIGTAVSPESVTVSNNAMNYSFSGAGIGGTGGLLKEGSGTLTFSNANTYIGSTVISNGIVQLAAPTAIPSGTVAYYTFDNPSNLGADSSGENNTLVPSDTNSTPVYSPDGVSGGGLYLNGSSTMNTGGGFPNGVPTGGSPYSIAVWEKVDVGAYINGGFVGWGTASPNLCNDLRLNGANSIVNYWFANDFTVTSAANPMDGNWHSIIATWDGTTNSIYVDGVLAGSRTPATAPNVQATGFIVGATVADGDFKGWLDNLMIVNRALTPAEIAGYQSAGALPPSTSVQIHGNGALALNGNNQTIGSLSGDTGTAVTLGNGVLTTGGNNSSSAFAGVISGLGSVIKDGTNVFTLSNANLYNGGTVINSGTLDVQHDGGLGDGDVTVDGGGILKLEDGSANSYISSTATLSLTSPAMVNLAFTGTNKVNNLVIDGVAQASGTWGSSSSPAINVDNTHFSGTGTLTVGGVTPPPPPTILPVYRDVTGTNMVVRVTTVAGHNYIIESTTNLVAPITWSMISTNAGTGGTITNVVPIRSAQPREFFRFVVQ